MSIQLTLAAWRKSVVICSSEESAAIQPRLIRLIHAQVALGERVEFEDFDKIVFDILLY